NAVSVAVMRSLVIVAFIAFTACTPTDAQNINPCCVAVSRHVVEEPILDFKFQMKNLPCVRAIILVTAEKMYCTDPRHKTFKCIQMKQAIHKKRTTPAMYQDLQKNLLTTEEEKFEDQSVTPSDAVM
uniref:Chemokine interleukin-8-like domain-containing protein n=1 Tax=Astyanax mexicanus TaxID=7994 RepID=A0A8B9GYG5_ASTMX